MFSTSRSFWPFYDNSGLFRRFPRATEDFWRLTKRSDHCRRCPKNPPNTWQYFFGNSKYKKKLANLTANTQKYGRITPNIKPHSEPPSRLVRSLQLCQVSIRQPEKGTARSLQYNIKISWSLNYAFIFTRIFVPTNLAWTMQSVSLDIRIRGFFANASLVTRENTAKQVIMWPANADIFSQLFSPVFAWLRHKEYFSGRNKLEIRLRLRLRLSYTESPASKLETHRGPLLRDPSRWLEKRKCILPRNREQVNVAS